VNIYDGASTSKAESGLGNGNYRYRVKATNVTSSDYRTGTFDCVVTLPPSPPASITYPATDSDGAYTVSWAASSGATSYQLDRSTNSGSTYSNIQDSASTSKAESCLDSGNYRYRVKATNAGGSSAYTTGTFNCVVLLAPPASITYPYQDGDGAYTVTWTAASGATSYQLDRSINSGSTYSNIQDSASTSRPESGLAAGKYRYRVKATYDGASLYKTGTYDCLVNTANCFPTNFTTFNDWKTIGKPMCWCGTNGTPAWKYQCDGDGDNATQVTGVNYRIYTNDYNKLSSNWKKKITDPTLDACADYDHKPQVSGVNYRVYTNDYNRMLSNWKKKDSQLSGNCPKTE
jgi:hypothetical protein